MATSTRRQRLYDANEVAEILSCAARTSAEEVTSSPATGLTIE